MGISTLVSCMSSVDFCVINFQKSYSSLHKNQVYVPEYNER